jgi:hypothetical protein
MAWTNPTAWVAGDPLTAARLNSEIKDNLLALKNPPTAQHVVNEAGANYSANTGATTFADIDATDLALSIVTTGGDVLVHFHGTIFIPATGGNGGYAKFDVAVDGTRNGGDDGYVVSRALVSTDKYEIVSFTRLITGLSAASHTFKLQWATNCAVVLYAGFGTTNLDLHPQFWVREI